MAREDEEGIARRDPAFVRVIAMGFISFLCEAIAMIVFVDVISSWFVKNPNGFPRSITGPITAPLYAPVRAILKPEALGGIDVSPIVVIVGLQALARALPGLAGG